MINLSMAQALGIWSELEQCYSGINGYGGDVAELYAYRFLPANPSASIAYLTSRSSILKEASEKHFGAAANSLYAILEYFRSTRNCQVLVEDRSSNGENGGETIWSPIGTWVASIQFCHRIHVKVIPEHPRDHKIQRRNLDRSITL